MKDNNIIVDKSKKFAVRIVKLYIYLTEESHEYVLSKQLLRSGTSVGANVREATRAQSKQDFYHKLNIALKEADESAYWIELLSEGEFITKAQFESIYKDCDEVVSLLVSITKSQKN